jgi:hypothetical protein
MKKLLAGMAIVGFAASSAVAETRYDHKIEQAAVTIAAGKMGKLRGGFSFNARLVYVTPSALNTGSVADRDRAHTVGTWRHGLAPAVEAETPPARF